MSKVGTRGSHLLLPLLLLGRTLYGCGDEPAPAPSCSLDRPTEGCSGGLVCEEVGGQPACAAPLVVRGRVIDPAGKGVANALVAALDGNDAPATGTATTGLDGGYELRVPTPRSASGAPIVRHIRLRASAAGFDPFPSGLRRSLPLETSSAAAESARLVFTGAGTEILLYPLPAPAALGAIAGEVKAPAGRRGVLVVAEGPATATAISDNEGRFVIFNVVPGAYNVRGYAADVSLAPASVAVAPSARTSGVDLLPVEGPLGTVSGNVNIVNAPGGSMTSVVLVVASTFNEALARGEVPPGLRAPGPGAAPSVAGPFSITGVPDGEYVVLAAFENDNLVRDPDASIGGTQIQRISVGLGGAPRQVSLAASFKITEALAVLRPGAGESPEQMTGTPTFVWKDDSSEDRYAIEVRDAKGNLVWRKDDVPKQTGGEVSVVYAGPALAPATLHQFRVTSYRRETIAISQTEDLKGLFLIR